MTIEIRCLTCDTVVQYVARRINGCGCDPDAPTWCYIDNVGVPHGLSSARWTRADTDE